MEVTKETARFFFEQICGEYNGSMAPLPFHPTLKSLMDCHGINKPGIDRERVELFTKFLNKVVNELDKESAKASDPYGDDIPF